MTETLAGGVPHDQVVAVLEEFGGLEDLTAYGLAATVVALRAELAARAADGQWRVLWEQERYLNLRIRRVLRGWEQGRTLEDAVTALLKSYRAVTRDHRALKARIDSARPPRAQDTTLTPLDDTWTTRT